MKVQVHEVFMKRLVVPATSEETSAGLEAQRERKEAFSESELWLI